MFGDTGPVTRVNSVAVLAACYVCYVLHSTLFVWMECLYTLVGIECLYTLVRIECLYTLNGLVVIVCVSVYVCG